MSVDNKAIVLPSVGSMLVARRQLKAWENDNERGTDGIQVNKGDVGLLLQRWQEGQKIRLRMMIKGVIALFSHQTYCVKLNWEYDVGV